MITMTFRTFITMRNTTRSNIMTVEETCRLAKDNVAYPALLSTDDKNKMLGVISDALSSNSAAILAANAKDVERGKELPAHLIDRLSLSEGRIKDICDGIKKLVELDDPIGKVIGSWINHAGLQIMKVAVPLGVVGIIYEARPNVTCDVIALCLKTGNAAVLRGSKDAYTTNAAIVDVIKTALKDSGYNPEFIQLISDTTREGAADFMHCDEYVDVLIPRGSAALIRTVKKNSSVPVIETGAGNCHLYVEKTADPSMAETVLVNGKLRRPSVCNALESMLVDREIAAQVLPTLLKAMTENNVKIHGCEETCAIYPDAVPATDEDYGKEYLGYEISCKVVSGVDEAIAHINKYGTHHSDAVITTDNAIAEKFLREVDSAAVYVNASTAFTDGFEYGFGAEIGISTQKLHARGPMGLEQMTSYKYQILGRGQVRK